MKEHRQKKVKDPFASNESLIDLYLPSPKRVRNNFDRQNFNGEQPSGVHRKTGQGSLDSIRSQSSNEPSGSYDFDSQFDILSFGMTSSAAGSNRKTIGQKKLNGKSKGGVSVEPAKVDSVDALDNEPVDDGNFGQINAKLNEILARVATLEKTRPGNE